MQIITPLDIVAITLISMHFGVPTTYYWYAKTKWLPKPWGIKVNPLYKPKVTVIIPTYNEAKLIKKKLDDITNQKYPRDRLEVIVIDSASSDGTPTLVREWAEKHRDVSLKLIVENLRRGKAHALNIALSQASGEIIIITDADSWWLSKDTILNVTKLLSDSRVGAVSCIKEPIGVNFMSIEKGYRKYYNLLRIMESKAWSTPIFHGELAAFRKSLLKEIGGFPTDIGADDSYTATLIALKGYRSIIHDSLTCVEVVPRKEYFLWRVRRAQHLIQHFSKMLKLSSKSPSTLKLILKTEIFMHVFNPWLLTVAVLLLFASLGVKSFMSLTLLGLGSILMLTFRKFRMWIYQQVALIVAAFRNLYTKELAWSKAEK